MDQVTIRDLRVKARVGVTEDERARAQVLIINITIDADLSGAVQNDELSSTIDYSRVVEDVAEFVRSSETKLLETLGGGIVDRISKMKGVDGVTVEVLKESAPTSEEVGPVGVRISKR